MANEFQRFYLDEEEMDYLTCTESKWTILNPTTSYLIKAVRGRLFELGYDNLIIKSSFSDYSKSRELTFPVALFFVMRGMFLPPALSAMNKDTFLIPQFNDSGAPVTDGWKRRFTDAVDRYYTGRFIDVSLTKPGTVFMRTPPSEVMIKTYLYILFKQPSMVDMFCVAYDDLRDFYIFGVSPLPVCATHVHLRCGAKFLLEVIHRVKPIVRSVEDVQSIFQRRLETYRDELVKEGFHGEVG